jgi:hypothetical protein
MRKTWDQSNGRHTENSEIAPQERLALNPQPVSYLVALALPPAFFSAPYAWSALASKRENMQQHIFQFESRLDELGNSTTNPPRLTLLRRRALIAF